MLTIGRAYKATGEDAKARNIRKKRTIYVTTGNPTPEQKRIIDKVERGVVDGDWQTPNPYNLMRTAEYMGIDFYEEELRADGKWHRVANPDEEIMQAGAL